MIRELIEQIELEKLAGQDPEAFLGEMTKRAFFDELEMIEKDAGLKLLKRVLKGAKAPKKATTKAPRESWTANLQPTPNPAAVASSRMTAASQAANQSSAQGRRAWELADVVR